MLCVSSALPSNWFCSLSETLPYCCFSSFLLLLFFSATFLYLLHDHFTPMALLQKTVYSLTSRKLSYVLDFTVLYHVLTNTPTSLPFLFLHHWWVVYDCQVFLVHFDDNLGNTKYVTVLMLLRQKPVHQKHVLTLISTDWQILCSPSISATWTMFECDLTLIDIVHILLL